METLRSLLNEFAILRLTGNGFKNPTSFNRDSVDEVDTQDVDDPIKFDRTDGRNIRGIEDEDNLEDADPTDGCNCECCQKWHNFFEQLYDKDNNEEGQDEDENMSGEDVWADKHGDVDELKYRETPENDEIEDEYLPASWPH
jgi:hypothetical protein